MSDEAAAPADLNHEETWLSRFCSGLLESTWLVAFAAVPVLCIPYTYEGLEPQKIILLEVLALVAAVAGLIKFAENRSAGRTARVAAGIPLPLVLLFVAIAVSAGVSALVSVVPSMSLEGNYDFRFNVFARLSLMILGAALALNLRSAAQIERLVAAVAAGAVPVALYAILQRTGADPLRMVAAGGRTLSLIGHPIFLASYLWLIFPICLWRAVLLFNDVRTAQRPRSRFQVAGLVFHGVVALLILTAFLTAESRGPFLGFVAGMVFFAIVAAAYWNRRRLLIFGTGAGVFAALCLALVIIPQSPLAPLRSLPMLSRFANINLAGNRDVARDTLWNEGWKLMTSRESIRFPKATPDKFSSLRPWFGFGPETLDHVLPLRFRGFGLQAVSESRFHNLLWDIWFSTGWLGLTGFISLIVLLFFYAYQRLGLIASLRDRVTFWSLSLGSAALGATSLALCFGGGYGALGMQAGLVAGLILVPVVNNLQREPKAGTLANPQAALLLALLAALAGHLVDTGFAWQISVNGLGFWAWSGLIIALSGPFGARHPSLPAHQPANDQAAVEGVPVTAMILPISVLTFVVVGLPFSLKTSPLFTAIIALSFCASVLAFLFAAWATDAGRFRAKVGAFSIVGSLGVAGLAFGIFKALTSDGRLLVKPGSNTDVVLQQGRNVELLCLLFLGLIVGVVIFNGWLLARKTSDKQKPASPAGLWAAVVGLGLASWLAATAIIPPFRADVWAWWAAYMANATPDASAESCRRAITLAPQHLVYRMMLFRKLMVFAGVEWLGQPERHFREAESVLLAARQLTTLNRTGYELGHLYLIWALHEKDTSARRQLAEQAASSLDQALEFEHESPSNWTDRALVDLLLLDRKDDAKAKIQKANEFSRQDSPAAWTRYYHSESTATLSPGLKRQYLERAVHYAELAVEKDKVDGKSPYENLVLQGTLHRTLGNLEAARASLSDALNHAPDAGPWQANAMLAHVCLDKGEKTSALEHSAKALTGAPENMKPAIQQLQLEILGLHQMQRSR